MAQGAGNTSRPLLSLLGSLPASWFELLEGEQEIRIESPTAQDLDRRIGSHPVKQRDHGRKLRWIDDLVTGPSRPREQKNGCEIRLVDTDRLAGDRQPLTSGFEYRTPDNDGVEPCEPGEQIFEQSDLALAQGLDKKTGEISPAASICSARSADWRLEGSSTFSSVIRSTTAPSMVSSSSVGSIL